MTDLEQRIREGFLKRTAQELRGPTMAYSNGFKDGFRAALPRWIPVGERLPDDDSSVLVFLDNGDWQEIDIMPRDRFWKLNGVTHWMPIPQPPEREECDGLLE